MAEIQADSGGDPTKAVISAIEGVQEEDDSFAKLVADLWFQESTDWLTDAAQRRSALGKRHGRKGRAQNNLSEIADKAVPPFWDSEREAWVFGFPHIGAVFQEFGAMPHEIRAKKAEMLAFEWPDAPQHIQEQFSHTEGDLVFFESINHPGIPAIGFVRYGRQKAKMLLEAKGYDTEDWIEGESE